MPRGKRRRDVAIYSPAAAYLLEQRREARGEGVAEGGGRELQMALLAEGLAARGIEVGLIAWPSRGQPSGSNGGSPLVVDRPAYAGNVRIAGRLIESIHVWRALKRADAAVYVFRGGGPHLLIAAAFCRFHRRTLVFSAANDLDFDFERPDRTRSHLVPYRAALRRADLIIAQRDAQAELARRAGFGPVTVIPSFAESAETSSASPEAFLWVGRLVEYKRPFAYLRLAESLPELRFRMIWYPTTETDQALIDEFVAAAEKVENLELLEVIPRPVALDLIARSTAIVLTSEAEGMPNVCLEAWARGVPVISLDFDPDGKIAGLGLGLFADGSETKLREAARTLWGDGALRAELGERGREYVVATHSPEAVIARWVDVLRRLLPGKHASDRSQRT